MEPKFILSKSKVVKQYNILKNLGVKVSYSWKTNAEVGKILEKESDSLFSIHIIEEIPDIKDKKRIWFFVQAWNKDEIKKLIDKGINNFVIDNEYDLKELINFLNESEIKVNLLLRMKFQERRIQTGKYFVYGFNSRAVNNWILKLKNNEKINKIGIHVHRKSQNTSEWNLKYEIKGRKKIKFLVLMEDCSNKKYLTTFYLKIGKIRSFLLIVKKTTNLKKII